MTATEIDGTVVDDAPEENARQEMAVVPAAPPPALAVTPQVTATELVERLDVIREAADKAMQRDVDFGVIPGTNKPTLLKPGAEKLGVLFQLDVQLSNEKRWGPGDHLTVVSHATVFHAPTGARLGYGEGVCTTRERKYAYRKQERTCPQCGAAAIIKGKAEFGGGWLCWKKRDGCDAKFTDGAPEIEAQEAGEIDNPDLPDLWNTVVKMAEKRARIDAVLAVTGASALFTQDMEDAAVPSETPAPANVVQTVTFDVAQELHALTREAIDSGAVEGKKVRQLLISLGASRVDSLGNGIASLPPESEGAMRDFLASATGGAA